MSSKEPTPAGFNGATANSPWMTATVPPTSSDDQLLLQWGHSEFAVDDASKGKVGRSLPRSFNGATANSPWMTTDVSTLPATV
jgi:hypothetical protein